MPHFISSLSSFTGTVWCVITPAMDSFKQMFYKSRSQNFISGSFYPGRMTHTAGKFRLVEEDTYFEDPDDTLYTARFKSLIKKAEIIVFNPDTITPVVTPSSIRYPIKLKLPFRVCSFEISEDPKFAYLPNRKFPVFRIRRHYFSSNHRSTDRSDGIARVTSISCLMVTESRKGVYDVFFHNTTENVVLFIHDLIRSPHPLSKPFLLLIDSLSKSFYANKLGVEDVELNVKRVIRVSKANNFLRTKPKGGCYIEWDPIIKSDSGYLDIRT